MDEVQAMATALVENGYGTTDPAKDAADVLAVFKTLTETPDGD